MPISRETFIEQLTVSGLMPLQELEHLLDALPPRERPRDGETLARWLVEQGHLTAYQALRIYQGRTSRLVLDNYVILDELGAGGMGRVYKARHTRMKRVVALKVLPENVAKDPKIVARFQREMQAAARLMHPNIVTAFDADETDGVAFLVMEYVPGKDLASLVRRHGPLPVHQALCCVLDAARGLDYAHRHGVTHRDIKPANLLLCEEADPHGPNRRWEKLGTVKILDLGVARIEAATPNERPESELTGTGMVIGTVDYMAPEQALETRNADHRSDIYSLGMTLYFLLTGRPAYTGDSALQRFVKHREGPIPSLAEAGVPQPAALDAVFARMVAKKPQDRFQSMSEVIAALEDVQSQLSEPIAGDVTAIAVTDEGDKSMQKLLQALHQKTPVRQHSEAALSATDVAEHNTHAIAPKPGTRPLAPDVTERVGPAPAPSPRRWVWPAIVVGICALLLLWPRTGKDIEERAEPTADANSLTQDPPPPADRFALQFAAPQACVFVPALPLDLSQPFAFEAWCRPAPQSGSNNVGRFVGELGPVQLKIWKDLWQSPIVDPGAGGARGVFLETPIEQTPRRTHVAFQWTGAEPLLFVDGQPAPDQLGQFNLEESPHQYLQRLFAATSSLPLRLGNFEYGKDAGPEASGQFGGQIEAVRISQGVRYKEAFDPAELIDDPHTVALYDFHEGTGDTLHDISGHGHHGTIIEATWQRLDHD